MGQWDSIQYSKTLLAKLMDPASDAPVDWTARDLQAILTHQLDAPLGAELEHFAAETGTPLADAPGAASLRQLFAMPDPPHGALALAKDYAKTAMNADDALPRDAARVLYVLAIAASRGAITKLSAAEIEREARRCLSMSWLTEDVRELLRQALKR